MESFLYSWAVSVTVAILFSSVVSMLLPESGIKKYVSVVMGIVVTVIILAPAVSLFNGNDVQNELKNAFGEAGNEEIFHFEGAQYKDYIYELYKVYVDDEGNKNE